MISRTIKFPNNITTHPSISMFLTHFPKTLTNLSTAQPQNCPSLIKLGHKDWLSPTEVLKIFKSLKDPETVVTTLNIVSKRKDYKPSEALYSLVINKLAHAKKFDCIDEILLRIKLEKNCRLSDEFFYDVIKAYGNVGGLIDRAIELLFDMPNYSVWPSVKTFSFVLNLLVVNRQYEIVHVVYLGASKLGVAVDACCLNILVKGLCECGSLDAAFQVLDEFPKQECRPNVRTFTTLMRGLCKEDRVDEAFSLLERMEGEGISPDTITFNVLLSGLKKQGKVERCVNLFERMKLKGCYPNSGSYQEVLYSLLEAQKFVEGEEIMCRMISQGIRPSFLSYKKVIDGLCNNNLIEEACKALKQMVEQGFVPRMGTWETIVETLFCRNSDTTNVSDSLLELMEN